MGCLLVEGNMENIKSKKKKVAIRTKGIESANPRENVEARHTS